MNRPSYAETYQTRPSFQSMLWYWSQCSEFATDFTLAEALADEPAEQDELRPHLRQIIELYHAHRSALLEPFTLTAFRQIHGRIRDIREQHASAWLKSNIWTPAA